MAAWTLVTLGRKETGLACLRKLLDEGPTIGRELFNVPGWMEEDAVPLVREYLAAHPKKATNILAKIAQDHGIELPKYAGTTAFSGVARELEECRHEARAILAATVARRRPAQPGIPLFETPPPRTLVR